MQKIIIFIACLVCCITTLGQTHSSADSQFKSGKYAEAQVAYKALLKNYPSNALYLYRYARCAQELGDDSTAIEYFIKSGNRYNLKHLYIGDSYLRLWNTEAAIEAYHTYIEKEPDEQQEYVQKKLEEAEKLQRYLRRVEKIQVIDSVEIAIDQMLDVVKLSAEAGHLSLDSMHSIVYTNQRNDKRVWASYHEGSRILLTSHRLMDHWSNSDTLPTSINFATNQCSPYLLSDGVTIYFAAEDENGIGGLDIYVSRYNTTTESYTTPENIGIPYNSPANEYMMIIDEVHQVGYIATDRSSKPGFVHVYSFAIPEQKQYWRNLDNNILVKYAKLLNFELYQENKEICENLTTEKMSLTTNQIVDIGDFRFVINDSIVYNSLEDFQNSEAIAKYNKWKQLEQQYQSEQQQLHLLREEYVTADNDRKKELTPAILQLENNQSQLLIQCEKLLLTIREIENQSTQE
jgi:hypothetical protein